MKRLSDNYRTACAYGAGRLPAATAATRKVRGSVRRDF